MAKKDAILLSYEDSKFIVDNKETHSLEECAIARASLQFHLAQLTRDTKESKKYLNSLIVPLEEYMERKFLAGDNGDPTGWDRNLLQQIQLPLTLGGKPYTPIAIQEVELICKDEKSWKALVEGDPIKFRDCVKFVQNTVGIKNSIINGTALPEVKEYFSLKTTTRTRFK